MASVCDAWMPSAPQLRWSDIPCARASSEDASPAARKVRRECMSAVYTCLARQVAAFPCVHDEGIERIAGGRHPVLRTIHLKRDRPVADALLQVGVPQRFTRRRVERNKVARRIAGEDQVSGRAQYARAPAAPIPF